MSTLRVDRIEPYQSSSIDIVGFSGSAAGGATTGSNSFDGNQTVTGSINITGQYLVNGVPITGSGGGSINTASLATTGSNVFQGNQNINGTLAVTASGTELKVNNDGTIDVTSTNGFNVIGSMTLVGGGLDVDGSVTASAIQSNAIQTAAGVLNISAGSGAILFMGGNKLEVSGSIEANGNITGNNVFVNTIDAFGAVSASNGFSGNGSGITNVDAQTLDGLDSIAFAKTGSANTFYGAQSVTNGAGNTTNYTPLLVSNVDTSGGMGQTKNISLSANPSSLGGPLSAWTEPTLYGLGNAGPYQIAEFQSQGNYTDGTATFKKPLIVSGSVTITGNVTAANLTGSGGGTINTGSFATTGSNTFIGDQTITGSIKLSDKIESTGKIILKPEETDPRYLEVYNTAAQDTHITASGGYLYLGDDTTYVAVNNYGVDRVIYITADNGLTISGSTNITGSVNITGDYKINGVSITGSGGTIDTGSFATTGSNEFVGKQGVTGSFEVSGSIILTGSLLMTGSATFVNNGPSTFNGDTVISTIDSLPSGTPGQIAFQGGKMWVFISGQWNEVSFVAPTPSSYEYSMGYDASSSGSSCGGSPSNFYSNTLTLGVGEFLWTGPGLATKVNNGYYASSSIVYEVTGGDGEITATGSCPIPHFYSPVGYNSTDSGSACGDSSSEFYSPCSSIAVGCRLSPGSAMIGAMNDGFYALSGSWFEVTGGDGVISSTGACS